MKNITYDLIVIGAGPGGYVAAIKAAQLEKKVLLIENKEIGGTCLNRGCIPTKTLIHATELLSQIKDCERLGIKIDSFSYDMHAIHQRKDEVVNQLRLGIESLIKSNKIDFIQGTGTILSPHIVKVAEVEYKASNILIATGSTPTLPKIDGIECPSVVTSDELLQGDAKRFDKLIIIGGGVIGVEFATIYNALGCDVTIIEALDRILPTMDREISQNLSMILKKRGVKIYTSARVEKIEQSDEVACHFTQMDKVETLFSQTVLVSIGRSANTSGLLGEGINLQLEGGKIPVNESLQTCIPSIYAIGDVTKASIQLAHAASAQGINAVSIMFGAKPPMNLDFVPSCIYTNPEIAVVGMTADEAKTRGIAVKTGKFIMSANSKSIIALADRGFIKVVFDEKTEVILGAQLMCERATDIIGELATAVVNRLTLTELSSVIRPHPTFGEGVGEAIEDVCGHAIHIPKKR